MQLIDSGSGRRRRTAAWLMALALIVTVGGCTGSDEGSDAADPSASPTALDPAGARETANRMTGALAAAGGGTMKATLEAGSITGQLSFGPLDPAKKISEIWNTGTFVSVDRRIATYLMHTGPGPEDVEIYVNDGTPINGRPWARIPQFASQMKDAAAVVKDHPNYRNITDSVPGLQPHVLPSLIAAQTGLVKSPAPETVVGVEATHYLGSFDGTPPTAGGPTTFELWIDKEGRPAQYLSYLDEVPVSVTYGEWKKRPPVRTPPAGDISVIPSIKP